jgi:hypothetical protein
MVMRLEHADGKLTTCILLWVLLAGALLVWAGVALYRHPLSEAIRAGWARYNAMTPEERERELAELRGDRPQRNWADSEVRAAATMAPHTARNNNATADNSSTNHGHISTPSFDSPEPGSALAQSPFLTLV